jgi:hypothetical protein
VPGTNGVSGWQQVSAQWDLPAVGQTIAPYAECPAGKKATGGGWFGPWSNEVAIARAEAVGTAFAMIVKNLATPLPNYIRVTVICVTAQ